MTMVPIGQVAVVKSADDETGEEEFTIIYTDPTKAGQAGYIWSTNGPYTEVEARAELAVLLAEPTKERIDAMLAVARSHYDEQQKVKKA